MDVASKEMKSALYGTCKKNNVCIFQLVCGFIFAVTGANSKRENVFGSEENLVMEVSTVVSKLVVKIIFKRESC